MICAAGPKARDEKKDFLQACCSGRRRALARRPQPLVRSLDFRPVAPDVHPCTPGTPPMRLIARQHFRTRPPRTSHPRADFGGGPSCARRGRVRRTQGGVGGRAGRACCCARARPRACASAETTLRARLLLHPAACAREIAICGPRNRDPSAPPRVLPTAYHPPELHRVHCRPSRPLQPPSDGTCAASTPIVSGVRLLTFRYREIAIWRDLARFGRAATHGRKRAARTARRHSPPLAAARRTRTCASLRARHGSPTAANCAPPPAPRQY